MKINIFANPSPTTSAKPLFKRSGAFGELEHVAKPQEDATPPSIQNKKKIKTFLKMNGEDTPARLRMLEKIKSRQINKR